MDKNNKHHLDKGKFIDLKIIPVNKTDDKDLPNGNKHEPNK